MPTDAIRDTIEWAKQQEQQQGHMAELFKHYIDSNAHLPVQLPPDHAENCLLDFIISYIECVPDFIDTARDITQQASIEEYSEPFLSLAEDYFLKPPEIISRLYGLLELMDEAYLAHRLMEEINDRFMAKTSIPLVPLDMTLSNILVHSIIGEPFANELDEAVHYTAERTMIKEHVYEQAKFKAYVEKIHQQNNHQQQPWPCLIDQLAINLPFPLL